MARPARQPERRRPARDGRQGRRHRRHGRRRRYRHPAARHVHGRRPDVDVDLEEALNAATAIGDDKLQKEGQGYIVPDTFTHGTSAQGRKWFKPGYDTGNVERGDTFNTLDL